MTPLLDIRRLVKVHARRGGLFAPGRAVRAVDDVSFTVRQGEWFALVGESGSGKTTAARCISRLTPLTSGEVHLQGVDLGRLRGAPLRAARRHVQEGR